MTTCFLSVVSPRLLGMAAEAAAMESAALVTYEDSSDRAKADGTHEDQRCPQQPAEKGHRDGSQANN